MTLEHLQVAQHGAIRLITLNRPAALNALNGPLLTELETVMDDVARDRATRGVVLIGSGTKAFAAGADIAEFPSLNAEQTYQNSRRIQHFFSQKLEGSAKPVLAAVNGFALGGGFELALACHLRVASDNAKFGLPEIKLGLIPGYGGTQRLQRLVGYGKALSMMLTADMIDAQDALTHGLVTAVFPQEKLLNEAMAVMNRILSHSSQAAVAIIQALQAAHNPHVDGFELEAKLFSLAMESADGREGVAAFLDKRKADFPSAR